MQLLRFNGFAPNNANDVDIDSNTNIGITIQAYNFKEIGQRKVNVSNTFSIPKTAKNLKILDFPDNPQSTSELIYKSLKCEYWVDNLKLVDGRCYIKSISDRINIIMYSKPDIWSTLAKIKFKPQPDYEDVYGFLSEKVLLAIRNGFQKSIIEWFYNNYYGQGDYGVANGYGIESDRYITTDIDYQLYYLKWINNKKGLCLPYFLSNLASYNDLETDTNLFISHYENNKIYSGGHMCIYAKTIFEYIEWLFDIKLGATTQTDDLNIFDDDIASNIYIPLRNIIIRGDESNGFYLDYTENEFLPSKEKYHCNNKTLYDFTKSFFSLFNCVIDTNDNENTDYSIRRLDDILEAPIIDFSGNFTGDFIFSPIVSGYKQQNYITYSDIYSDGELTGDTAKFIQCDNRNIEDGGKDSIILKIDGFVNSFITNTLGVTTADLREAETFKTFSFFINSESRQPSTTYNISDVNGVSTSQEIFYYVANLYSLSNEYNTVTNMMKKPKIYTVKKWLNPNQAYNLKFFRRYFIKELNGFFFINKISGFNPSKAFSITTIELIKIN